MFKISPNFFAPFPLGRCRNCVIFLFLFENDYLFLNNMIIFDFYFFGPCIYELSLQETVGYFFCLEDRAILCRKCDVAIHTTNAYVSAHQRFLFTGVKVGLEPTDPGVSSSSGKSLSSEKMSEIELYSSSRNGCPVPLAAKCNKILPVQFGDFEPTKSSFAGGSTTGSTQHWYLDDFFGLTEPNQSYGYMDNSSSKVIVPSNVCSFHIMCFCNFLFCLG